MCQWPNRVFLYLKYYFLFFLNRQWGQWVHRSGEKGQSILEGLKEKKVLVLFAQVSFEWVGEIQLLQVGLNQDLTLQYYLQNKLPHVLLVLTTFCISLRGFNDYYFWDSWQKSSAERTYWKTSCEMSPLWFLFYEEWIRPSTSYLGSWR